MLSTDDPEGAWQMQKLERSYYDPGLLFEGDKVYVACGIGKIKIEEITKGIVPCLVAELVVLLLVTYIPALSTMLVG